MSNRKSTWKTKDGREIEIRKMDSNHIQGAFLTLCVREFKADREIIELWGKLDVYKHMKAQLEYEARKRGIKLKYPDQHPSYTQDKGLDWKTYFENERKNKSDDKPVTIIPTEQTDLRVSKLNEADS